MTPAREQALRDFLTAITAVLDIPQPASHADDDLYRMALTGAEITVVHAIRALLSGCLDNCAIHDEARVLRSLARPVAYPAGSTP